MSTPTQNQDLEKNSENDVENLEQINVQALNPQAASLPIATELDKIDFTDKTAANVTSVQRDPADFIITKEIRIRGLIMAILMMTAIIILNYIFGM